MKRQLVLLFAVLSLAGCNGQEHKEKKKEEQSEVSEKPKGSWKVNREFDENGNLVRYDSIYSYSSTDELEDFAEMDRDSIFKSFQSQFSRSFRGFDPIMEGGFFTSDSLFMKNFFADDFFENDFGQDFKDLDQMHKRMQAMQRRFLKRYHSGFKDQEPEKEEF